MSFRVDRSVVKHQKNVCLRACVCLMLIALSKVAERIWTFNRRFLSAQWDGSWYSSHSSSFPRIRSPFCRLWRFLEWWQTPMAQKEFQTPESCYVQHADDFRVTTVLPQIFAWRVQTSRASSWRFWSEGLRNTSSVHGERIHLEIHSKNTLTYCRGTSSTASCVDRWLRAMLSSSSPLVPPSLLAPFYNCIIIRLREMNDSRIRQVHDWCPRRNGSVLSQLSPFIPLSITDCSFHPALLKVSWFADSEGKRENDQRATKIKGERLHQWVHQRNVSFLYLVGLTWVALASFNLGGRKTPRDLGPWGMGFNIRFPQMNPQIQYQAQYQRDVYSWLCDMLFSTWR